jgi:hypothetical protein
VHISPLHRIMHEPKPKPIASAPKRPRQRREAAASLKTQERAFTVTARTARAQPLRRTPPRHGSGSVTSLAPTIGVKHCSGQPPPSPRPRFIPNSLGDGLRPLFVDNSTHDARIATRVTYKNAPRLYQSPRRFFFGFQISEQK